jgi:glycine hydroxymethyltransferase
VHYSVDLTTHLIDFNQLEMLVKQHRPKLIIAGASAYPRKIDFATFAQIAKQYNALLLADIAHIAGLVAAGLHPSPVGFADIITMTSQKTLRGPRGGIILSSSEWSSKIARAVMPGVQGGPHMNSIFAKAVMFEKVLTTEFKTYQQQIVANAKALAQSLMQQGLQLISNGTDNHLMLVDVFNAGTGISGRQATSMLESIGITANANLIPGDTQSALHTSGIRFGTPALTARGLTTTQATQVGQIIAAALKPQADLIALSRQVQLLNQQLLTDF